MHDTSITFSPARLASKKGIFDPSINEHREKVAQSRPKIEAVDVRAASLKFSH